MTRRILAFVLAAVMLLSVVPVHGAHTHPVHAADPEPTFVVDSVTAAAGETVDVTIRLENNPGVTSIKLSLEYGDALTLQNVVSNPSLGDKFLSSPEGVYPVVLNWYDGLKNVTGDWVFVTLTFAVAEDAQGTCPISIIYDANDVFDVDEENVHFDIQNGGVTVGCGHSSLTEVPAKAAGCETEGNIAYYICDCGAWFADSKGTQPITDKGSLILSKLGHSFTNYVKDAQGGTETAKCDRCNATHTRPVSGAVPTFIVDTVSAPAGKTVDVTIRLENNPGVTSIKLSLEYDDALTLQTVTSNSSLGDKFLCSPEGVYPVLLNWYDGLKNVTGDWVFVTLTFAVAEDAEGTCPISISYNPSDVFDVDEENVYFDIQNGGVTVGCGHSSLTAVPAKAAGCETEGNIAYYICDCGEWFADAKGTQPITDKSSVILSKLGHSFTNYVSDNSATCVEDGTETAKCDRCDETHTRKIDGSREDAVHRFPDVYISDNNADCTTDGTKHRTCSLCGETETVTDEGSALGHDYASVITEPTCADQGYTTHTCTRCGDSYIDSYVDATGHSMGAWQVTKAPTCTEKGTEQSDCANCDHFETRETDALGHSYVSVVTAPTCTKRGYTTHACSSCGYSYVDSHTDELGHYHDTAESLADGESIVLTDLNVVKHNKSLIFSAEVDSLGDGLISITHGKNSYGGNYIEITDTELKVYSVNKTAVCTEYSHGLTIEGKVSVRIDVDRSRATITIKTNSGTYVKKVTWSGCNGEISCGVEGAELSNVDFRWFALGIESEYWFFGDSWFNTTSNARWTKYLLDDGYTDVLLAGYPGMGAAQGLKQFRELLRFDVPQYAVWTLGMNNGDRDGVINASWLSATEEFLALCEEYGVTPILCTVPTTPKINNRLKNAWVIDSGHRFIDFDLSVVEDHTTGMWFDGMCAPDLGHPTQLGAQTLYPQVFADFPELAKADPSTCTHSMHLLGSREAECEYRGREEYYVCTLCGGQYLDAEGTVSTTTAQMLISPLGHDYFSDITAPTCTEQGYTTHTCKRCGDSYVDSYVNATGHIMGNWQVTKAPTCTEKGTEQRNCSNCDHFETRELDAKGHSYAAVVTAPTCTEQGYTTHTCTCGDSYVDTYTAALGHTYGDWYQTKAPTLEAEGEERRDCARCDEYQTRKLPMLVHNYTSVVTAPTCTEKGHTTHTCANCGDVYVDTYVDALGHSFTKYASNGDATCTADGTKTANCDRCDASDTVTDVGSKTGHKLGAWYETKAPTCTEKGTEQRDCANCDHFETRETDAKGHSYVSVVTAPTCTEQGYTTHTCACGDSYVDSYVAATGHKLGNWYETKVPTCTTEGTERRDCSNCDHFETRETDAKGHSYASVVTAPTCTERGYTTHTCSVCGDSYVDGYVAETGHAMGNWYETKAPTCTEKGTEQSDCANCDHFETRELEAKGHSYAAVVTAPTCTEQGYTTHTCVCGDSYVDTYTAALGHAYGEWYQTKAPTYTEEGEERRDCSRCDEYQTRKVAALQHEYTETVIAPTCTEQGYTVHHCAECGDEYIDTYMPALGHSFTKYASNGDATCTADGTKTAKCDRCDATDTVTDVGSKTGHTMGNWYETKAPTCTVKGTEQRDCSNCDYFETRETAAKGHSYKDVVTAPTCTERGYTTHTCSACGESYVDSYVNAVGHKLGNWYETKAPTCTEKGTEQRDCVNCDHYETRETDAKGHSYKAVVITPTCTERGYTTHTCTICGNSYVDSYVAATGHSMGAWYETKAPTCTTKGTERRDCGNCDHYETRETEAKGHSYKDVVTAPTCTERGYTTHTCACGDSYIDSYVAATGHSMGKWIVIKAPTCTEKGTERRECANCDHYETRELDAKGHSYKDIVTAPTCTERGYTTHTCACGDSYVDSYTAALGHAYGQWYQTKAPTLEAEGEERRDCSRCDEYQTRKLPMLVHNYTSVVTAPTCTEKGYTTHTCTNCGDVYVDTYVDALGHSFTKYASNGDATCTADGTKTANCDRCDATDTVTDVGSKTGHTMGNWYETKAPTCTAKGTEQRDCSNCDYFETRETAAKGHSYTTVVTVPTCTEQGYTTHSCFCGESYIDSYVAAKGHAMGAWVETKAPTCTVKGTEQRDCANCDHSETRETAAKGHSYTAVVTAPTCTDRGYTTHTCACGDSYVDSYVAAKGHSMGAWVEFKAPTCTENGTEQRRCSACDHLETRETEAMGHSYRVQVTESTCTEQGYTTHTCSVCGDSFVDTYTAALGHAYGQWYQTKAPSYTEDGEERRDCSRCDEYQTRKVAALQHQYSETIVAPTCTEQGYTIHHCAECGDSYIDTYIAALGHSFTKYTSNGDATCTVDGTKTAKCDRCDATDTVTDVGSKTGHTMSDWIETKAPTCTEKGNERRECGSCDHFEIRETEAKGHSYKAVATVPTCTEKGYTTHTCSACGDSYVDSFVDATGHKWDSGVVTKEPTDRADGERTYTCSVCGSQRTESIPKLDHTHMFSPVVTKPTCTEEGFTTFLCSCGVSYITKKTDPLGHSWSEWAVTKEPNYLEFGERTHTCSRCKEAETEYINNNPFVDVGDSNRFKTPILWAYYEGITAGKTPNTFAPDAQVTRAQFVAFLWRAAGQPEPASYENPFTDVTENNRFLKPILWAYHEGITVGKTATTFCPDDTCTRGQVVTFLYRYAGSPEVKDVENPFTDVTPQNRFYHAILWAYAEGITSGKTATTFEINGPCARAQVVTFLFRYLEEKIK